MKQREKENEQATSKGYRLKTNTHKLIEKLQHKTKGTKDDVINRACTMLDKELKSSHKIKYFNKL